MKFDFSQPKESKLYERLKPMAGAVIRLVFDVSCTGQENIPKNGGFIIAANHIHFSDPILIIANCARTCHFMAKSELFSKPVLGSLLSKMNVFPVKRGASDKLSLGFAQRIIDNGWALGIFPEGTRSKSLMPQRAKNGVAYIAKKTKADVLPVSIYRTPGQKSFRPKITLRFGELIKNEVLGLDEKYSQAQLRAAAALIMGKITELWNMKHLILEG